MGFGCFTNAYVRLLICSYLDFKELCVLELLSSDWQTTVMAVGRGELWRRMVARYFPTLLADADAAAAALPPSTPSSSSSLSLFWKGTFARHYRWQTCVHTGEQFERGRNSPHAAQVACANGKDEGWHVSTLCPPELNPNLQPRPEDFILDTIRGPRREEFLFHFPRACCPLVAAYDSLVNALQAALSEVEEVPHADQNAFIATARAACPKHAELLIELRAAHFPTAAAFCAALPTLRLRRLMANKQL